LTRVIKSYHPDAILHYAAFALVGESVEQPLLYYRNNVEGDVSLASAIKESGRLVPLVFSSSCAVFGTPERLPMKEGDPKAPESPYGRSKLMAEQIRADVALALNSPITALRYFNACG